MLRVELLAFDDCPSRGVALERVRTVLAEERVTAEVIEVDVASADMAQALRFLGSPSIRINGVEIEPAARAAEQFGLTCRMYATANGVEGMPPMEMIRAALPGRSAV